MDEFDQIVVVVVIAECMGSGDGSGTAAFRQADGESETMEQMRRLIRDLIEEIYISSFYCDPMDLRY